MRNRGTLSSRLSLRGRQRPLRLEQLEIRQMLAGDLLTGMVSASWFGSYPAAGQPLHASAPSITASDTSAPSGTQAANGSSGQLDWIVQLTSAAASGVASPANAASLLPQGGARFQVLEGLGAVGEMLVRSYGITPA